MKTGIELIADERREQIEKHGRTIKRDVSENNLLQLEVAASKLLMYPPSQIPPLGWDKSFWIRITQKSPLQRLIIAGALIAAEIDRKMAAFPDQNYDSKRT